MPGIEYRMFFNNEPATQGQLNRVEEITVEQEVDMAWEARIQIPISVDDKGKWKDEDEPFMRTFSRARVEIKIADKPFVPLIDGPIVGFDSERSSQPGQSSFTLIVHDDSVNLNREDSVVRFDNLLDHEIAAQIYGEFDRIATTDIEDTPASGSGLPAVVVQRGTAMQILRVLARRQGKHAYILPGDNPGESIGVFKALPRKTDGLPPLILLGPARNIETFNTLNNAQSPSNVRASTLSITNKVVTTRTFRYRDLDLLGEQAAFENESDTTIQILPPHQGETVDLDQAITAKTEEKSYSYEITGSVLGLCYPGVLQPYRVIIIRAGKTPYSGYALIEKVVHTLTRSDYSQSFTLRRNARSEVANGDLENLFGSIF